MYIYIYVCMYKSTRERERESAHSEYTSRLGLTPAGELLRFNAVAQAALACAHSLKGVLTLLIPLCFPLQAEGRRTLSAQACRLMMKLNLSRA
jgi:hypothetical protein